MRRLFSSLFVLAVTLTCANGWAGEETMRAFPTYASVDGDELVVPVHVWVFEQEDDLLRRAAVKPLEEALDIDDDPTAKSLFRVRMLDFMVDNERGEEVWATLSGPGIETKEWKLGETPANGHLKKTLRVPYKAPKSTKAATYTLAMRVEDYDATALRLQVPLIGATGISIVSDIDDTVKVTNVLDRGELLRNSFARPFRAVEGMPEFLTALQKKHGAHVHYLSASPWNLYRDLEDWRGKAGLPEGTYHLRIFRAKDFGRTIEFLESSEPHKKGTLERLVKQFPKRKFILIGDSGERDPDIYGDFARKHPEAVEAIYIREVPGAKNDDARFAKAFRDVPKSKWKTIDPPKSIP